MFKSKLALGLLLISSVITAHVPAQPQPSEEEIAAMVQQMEEFLAMVKEVDGLYITTVIEMPAKIKLAAFRVMELSSKNELCEDMIGMPEPHTVIFRSPAGKAEAQKLKAALEKLGCKVELIELAP